MKIVNTLQGTRLKDKFLGYIAIFLIVSFLISLSKGIGRLSLVKREITKKQAEVSEIERKNEKLKEELARIQTPQYIEKQIRNKLGLVKTGEIVVVLPDAEIVKSLSPSIPEDPEPPTDPNWKKWMKLFL